MGRDVRYIEQVIIVAVANENNRRSISSFRQQSLDHRGIGFDGPADQPPKQAWTPIQKRGIAEKRSRQENVLAVLDEDAGNAEVSDGDLIARISAIRWRAPDSMRC